MTPGRATLHRARCGGSSTRSAQSGPLGRRSTRVGTRTRGLRPVCRRTAARNAACTGRTRRRWRSGRPGLAAQARRPVPIDLGPASRCRHRPRPTTRTSRARPVRPATRGRSVRGSAGGRRRSRRRSRRRYGGEAVRLVPVDADEPCALDRITGRTPRSTGDVVASLDRASRDRTADEHGAAKDQDSHPRSWLSTASKRSGVRGGLTPRASTDLDLPSERRFEPSGCRHRGDQSLADDAG